MERTQEESNKMYIEMSKDNIDSYLEDHDYKKAFLLLIMVLERLDNNGKAELVGYYKDVYKKL